MDDQQLLGNRGVKPSVTHDGKTYEFSFVGPKTRAGFTEWLKARSRAAIVALRQEFGDDDYRMAMDSFVRQCASGEFGAGSRTWRDALRTEDGFVEYLRLLLIDSHPQITGDVVRGLLEHKSDEIEVVLAQMGAGNPPKAGTPRSTSTGV